MIKTPLSTVIGGAFWTTGATIIGSSSKNLTQLIKSLFANNEQGFAYDPNDLTTLYQDAAGNIPVTAAGQPVGLMLDKSKGLTVGAELNATALPKITGNAPVATYNSTTKVGTVNRVDVSNQSFIVLSSAVGGKWYYVSVKNTGLSQIALRNSNNFGVDTTIANISPNGTFIGYVYVATNYVLGIASALGEGTFIVNTVKEIAGNHAYQSVSASRPILQQTPILGSTDVIINGDFSDGLTGWTAIGGASLSLTNSAIKVLNTGGGIVEQAQQSLLGRVTKGKTYAYSVNVKEMVGIPRIMIETGSVTLVNRSCTSVGMYTGIFTVPLDANTLDIRLRASIAASQYGVFDDVIVKEVTGYREGQNYLAFDGVDDFLQTNNIDFTATDKMSLFTGVRKNVNAVNILCELSADMNTNTGGFYLTTPETTLGAYGFKSRGSAPSNAAMTALSANSSPIDLAVLSAFGNISTATNTLRKNKIATTALYPLGTGNYGNYPLYIGRRAGTSLPFDGHIYGLIGIGRLTTDSETIALEKAIAKNTGVTL